MNDVLMGKTNPRRFGKPKETTLNATLKRSSVRSNAKQRTEDASDQKKWHLVAVLNVNACRCSSRRIQSLGLADELKSKWPVRLKHAVVNNVNVHLRA